MNGSGHCVLWLVRGACGIGAWAILSGSAEAQRAAESVRRVDRLENAPASVRREIAHALPRVGDLEESPEGISDDPLPTIMLTGYWPPSNEGVRKFSANPDLNPTWEGANWEGRGYDVYSYFPDFDPDDCSSCGKGDGDLEVDYQDTSADFWPLADAIAPFGIITFSRGFPDLNWEVEMNQFNRTIWVGDYLRPFQPTPRPPDDSVDPGALRLSMLPVQEIVDAVNDADLGIDAFICYSGDGGGFLSEFIAYHGVWYQDLHRSPTDPAWCAAGGHIHVGGNIDWDTTELAVEVSLRALIEHLDAIKAETVCQPDLGYGGPGSVTIEACGDELVAGGVADLLLSGAPADAPAYLFAGFTNQPTPFAGGTILPYPANYFVPYVADFNGQLFFEEFPGGGGPLTLFTQFVVADPLQADGYAISNTLAIEFLQ